MNVKIETIIKRDSIEQVIDCPPMTVYRQVILLQEEEVIKALKFLGWTPPSKEASAKIKRMEELL